MEKGQTYWVCQNHPPKKRELAFCSEYYPWAGQYTKIRVDHEYDKYYVCTVLPKDSAWKKSKPYRVTIQKVDISIGNIKIKGDSKQ